MSNQLATFAARLREHIGFCAADFALVDIHHDLAWAQQADIEFSGLAVRLFTLQYYRNAPYRTICEARGIQKPDAVAHWRQIPAVPTAAFKELDLTSLPPDQRTKVFHSSGTTGQRPSRHFHSAESLAIYEASLGPWLGENLGFAAADFRLLSLTPPPEQVPHSSLVHMFDWAGRNLAAAAGTFVGRVASDGTWTVDYDAALVGLTQKDPRPMLVVGTAFSFVHLADELAAREVRLKLPSGSRVLETGGYKGRSRTLAKADLHQLLTERLGVSEAHVVCEYGMSELSSQAYEVKGQRAEGGGRNGGRVFHFPPWARVQIISPETGCAVAEGETGLLQVFDLANVFSVVAIQTEDLAIRRGAGFELVGRAQLAEPRGCSLMTA